MTIEIPDELALSAGLINKSLSEIEIETVGLSDREPVEVT